MAAHRHHRHSLLRRIRRRLRFTRLQIAIVGLMVVAAAGGATSLVLLLRGPAPAPSYTAVAPPLELGPDGLKPVKEASTVPLTVRLIMPSIHIDIAVVQGNGVTVPMYLAVHYPGTDQPGGGSNALFYAHAQPGMFQAIYNLHKGDQIIAVRSDGTEVTYAVAVEEYVSYNDLNVLKPTPYDQITLLTCTSYDPYTPRFIVIGLPQ
jgi:LPXTG-site transpeptidase (sortase) family protein